jgi:hypothetical protein
MKYWYATFIDECPLCGLVKKWRERVYEREASGVFVRQALCGDHGMDP